MLLRESNGQEWPASPVSRVNRPSPQRCSRRNQLRTGTLPRH